MLKRIKVYLNRKKRIEIGLDFKAQHTLENIERQLTRINSSLMYIKFAIDNRELDGYEEHLRYGVFPGNLEDVK